MIPFLKHKTVDHATIWSTLEALFFSATESRLKFKNFLYDTGVLGKINFDIEEVGQPQPVTWGKCKLATASFGHGINTNLLQFDICG